MWSLWTETWRNWRSRERTKRGKRFKTQEMAGRFSFFEEALLGFEVQNYMRVAAAVQKAVQCYCVIDDRKIRAATQTSVDLCFKRVDSFGSSKNPWCRLSGVTLQPALRLPSLTTLQLYPLPPPLLLQSNSSCLFTKCQPPYAICCPVLFKVLNTKIKNVFLLLCVCVFF